MSDSRELRRRRREQKERRYKMMRRRILAAVVLLVILLLLLAAVIAIVHHHQEKVHLKSVHKMTDVSLQVDAAIATAIDRSRNIPQREDLKTVTDEDGNTYLADPDNICVLVNKEFHLSPKYEPDDLVTVKVPFAPGRSWDVQRMRADASAALTQLFNAAKEEKGYELYGASGYRSYIVQRSLFNSNVARFGSEASANFLSAKPGQSEHQLGLAMDLTVPSLNYRLKYEFEDTEEGKWVAENCWRFGFILRYIKDKTNITGYSYEPWHVRYVGKDLAKYLYDNNLTLEEYYGYGPKYDTSGIELKPDNESYE